jgi:hypothetical protein
LFAVVGAVHGSTGGVGDDEVVVGPPAIGGETLGRLLSALVVELGDDGLGEGDGAPSGV